ncbi:shikimate dehydrogenase [Mesobacterium sp. TK19101]|uniref:Shikimate dehydrogenase (NADP(+)) n=1 Tax=Mesobacterium hydrothermale TaxID=3111907 RepID=A0ABU6HP32_9RHOB|nr:shikimate dehydrogenase [Mesobacterium sp. TK19101]MEC3863213.1 shikimate dehydrogenase [Mesobacterium sp. TK19101]
MTSNAGSRACAVSPPRTVQVGLIGHGIQKSRTPKMHIDEGAAQGLDYRYALIDTALNDAPLADLLDRAEQAGFNGVNVTHPFKQAVMGYVDVLSSSARSVNAVNTVVFRDGKRFGHNTDYWGFAEACRRNLTGAATGRVLLIGAGGAGGAVANALVDFGVGELLICDRNSTAASLLVDQLNARVGAGRTGLVPDATDAMTGADGIVNATPVGMASHPGTPLPPDLLEPAQWVADIIYFPLETALLAGARARGCRTMDGSGMAVFQAVRAFELFCGLTADPSRMRATFDRFDAPA